MAQTDIVSPVTPSQRTLSDDVHLLAGLLGDVLRGSGGERAFLQTETAARSRRICVEAKSRPASSSMQWCEAFLTTRPRPWFAPSPTTSSSSISRKIASEYAASAIEK